MAGCAGFAAALPELLELDIKDTTPIPLDDGGMFVLCGSVNPITQRQLACAESNGFTRIHIRPDQKLNDAYFDTAEGKAALDGWCKVNEQNPWMILDANDDDDDNAQTIAYAQQQNMSIEDVRRCISRTLGKILPVFLQSSIRKTMMITGGDTLLQCMNQMEVWEMEPIYQVFSGVVLSRFRLAGKSHYAVTKSGGFGDENMLLNLRARILSQEKA